MDAKRLSSSLTCAGRLELGLSLLVVINDRGRLAGPATLRRTVVPTYAISCHDVRHAPPLRQSIQIQTMILIFTLVHHLIRKVLADVKCKSVMTCSCYGLFSDSKALPRCVSHPARFGTGRRTSCCRKVELHLSESLFCF